MDEYKKQVINIIRFGYHQNHTCYLARIAHQGQTLLGEVPSIGWLNVYARLHWIAHL